MIMIYWLYPCLILKYKITLFALNLVNTKVILLIKMPTHFTAVRNAKIDNIHTF